MTRPYPEPQEAHTASPESHTEAHADLRANLARVRSAPAPSGFAAARWDQLSADVLAFEREWLDTAIALGWTERDLFAVHPTRPEVRHDCAGLLWLLNGAEIAALDAECAVIRTKQGNTLTYRKRRGVRDEARLLWECVEN